MKTRLLLAWMMVSIVAAGAVYRASAESPHGSGSHIDTNSLTIGEVTYESVRWGKITPADVTIFHAGGVCTIPLSSLPEDLQKRFGYDAAKAGAFSAKEQQAIAEKRARTEFQQRAKQAIATHGTEEFKEPIEVGHAGVFKEPVTVVRVIDAHTMLARVPVLLANTGGAAAQYGVIGDADAVRGVSEYRAVSANRGGVVWSTGSREVVLRSITTQGMVTGDELKVTDVFQVTGTDTSLGTRRFVLEAITKVEVK